DAGDRESPRGPDAARDAAADGRRAQRESARGDHQQALRRSGAGRSGRARGAAARAVTRAPAVVATSSRWRSLLAGAFVVAVLHGCGRGAVAADPNAAPSRSARPGVGGASAESATGAANNAASADPGVIELLPLLRNGAIDVAGPVVDLGESQANPYL